MPGSPHPRRFSGPNVFVTNPLIRWSEIHSAGQEGDSAREVPFLYSANYPALARGSAVPEGRLVPLRAARRKRADPVRLRVDAADIESV
jgi:hypothetical protein